MIRCYIGMVMLMHAKCSSRLYTDYCTAIGICRHCHFMLFLVCLYYIQVFGHIQSLLNDSLPSAPMFPSLFTPLKVLSLRTQDQLQDETGCRIIISGRDDYFPGTHFRVLVILGDAPEAMLGVIEHLIPDIVEFGKKERAPAGVQVTTCLFFVKLRRY